MNKSQRVYLIKGDSLETIPLDKHPTEAIIIYMKEQGIKNPVLIQQGTPDYLQVEIMGHRDYVFMVKDLYLPSKRFLKNYILEALFPFDGITEFSVEIKEDKVHVHFNGNTLTYHERSYTTTSIKDIKDKVRRLR